MPNIGKHSQNKAKIDATKTDLNELSTKVMLGLNKALRKLVEESAAENRSLVIKINGEIKKIPAKDLLRTLSS